MKTIEVNTILSEQGLQAIRTALIAEPTTNFQVKESSTGKVFVSFGGFNGHIFDLWLRKSGTKGTTYKTFIRADVQHLNNIKNELGWRKIAMSEDFLLLVDKEVQEAAQAEQAMRLLITNFTDKVKAADWVNNNEGNYRKRTNRWANRAERLGIARRLGKVLEAHCNALVKGIASGL